MAKPTKSQQRDLDRGIEILRRESTANNIPKRRISRGISKRMFHTILDKASQPIEKPESDQEQS